MITGEAGIGKSRLVTEWTAFARRRGFVVLVGRAIEGGGSLRPLAQALMEAVRDRALPESDELRPFRAALSRVLPGFAAGEPVDSIVDPNVVLGEGVLRLLRSVGGSGTVLLPRGSALGRPGHSRAAGLSQWRTQHVARRRSCDRP